MGGMLCLNLWMIIRLEFVVHLTHKPWMPVRLSSNPIKGSCLIIFSPIAQVLVGSRNSFERS